MRDSPAFETHALMVFAVFDDVIDNLDGDVQTLLEKLESVARIHAKADGFSFEFFQVSLQIRIKCIHTFVTIWRLLLRKMTFEVPPILFIFDPNSTDSE